MKKLIISLTKNVTFLLIVLSASLQQVYSSPHHGAPVLAVPKQVHDISFKQFVAYVSEFNQSTASAPVSALFDFGYINAVALSQQLQGQQGVVFHYCLSEGENPIPYLAYRVVADSSSTVIDAGGSYYQSYGEGKFPFNNTSSIIADLLSCVNNLTPELKTVSGATVAADAARFLSLCSQFRIDNRAYFNAVEISELINENQSVHLKYYLGFDDSEIINHLRLCFVGVDPITKKNAIKHPITHEFFTFIDRSWP
jgi:hypothetical protein